MNAPPVPAQAAVPVTVRRAGRRLFVAALAIYAATTGGSMATDPMTYEVTRAIVEDGSVAMSRQVLSLEAHRGVDGRYYSPYGLGHAIYSVPFYVAGRVVEVNLGWSVGRADALRKAAFVGGSAVATALVVWIVFLFAYRLSGDMGAAVAVGAVSGFATLLWPYAKYGFNAPTATLGVVAGTYAIWTGVHTRRLGVIAAAGAAFGFAVLVRSELILAAAVAGLWLLWQSSADRRRMVRSAIAYGAPLVVAVAIMAAYNWARFGDIRDTGYLRDTTATFNTPTAMWEGFSGLLVSPGRSLFLYSPILLAGVVALWRLRRSDRATALLLGGVSVVCFAFYASLLYWDADRSYGPRYLLPIVPLLCVPLVHLRTTSPRPRWVTGLIVLSVAVQIPGVAIDFSKALPALDVQHPLLERRWNWQVSGLVLNTRALAEFAPDNVRYLTGLATPPPVVRSAENDVSFSDQFGFSLDFWWLYLFYFGKVSAVVALLVPIVLVSIAAGVSRPLWPTRSSVRAP